MSLWRLAKNSLGFYWRTNLGVLLTIAVSTAVLSGALVVGDSVRYSLAMIVKARLGATQYALVSRETFFRAELADDLAEELASPVAAALQLRGVIADGNDVRRANRIEVLGVDERFFIMGQGSNPYAGDRSEGVVLNEPLAARLGVRAGDEVVLRIEKPSLMSRDLPLTPDSDLSMAFRLGVRAIASESEFGRFSLRANQTVPLNVFVPLSWIQQKTDRAGGANVLLVAVNPKRQVTPADASEALAKCWQLADAGLELRRLDGHGVLEMRSKRVFIDESLGFSAMTEADGAVGVLTYFVNELRFGEKATPYSMVTAMGPSQTGGLIPDDMGDDEILINQWLAEDLGAAPGDLVELSYYVLTTMRKLQEQKDSFRVRAILPMEPPAVDPELMPDFPGLTGVENCRDWDAGIPIDLDKIRKKDEDYWDAYRGTPKAFVTLKAGREMWANRYGNLTAVRYPLGRASEPDIAGRLLETVDPASVGLFFQPVRELGAKAGSGTTDFGQLFLGLSMFLIIAVLVLTGLVFVFGVENRSGQIGMLLAVGFSPKQLRRLLFTESGALAVLGAIVGSAAALLYTKTMIYGLATAWQGAVSGSTIHFHAKPTTLLTGALAAIVVSLFAIWLTLRKQVSRPAHELLAGNVEWQFFKAKRLSKDRAGLWIAIAAVVGAVVLLAVLGTGDSNSVSAAFFGAGALLLIAGMGLAHALLRMLAGRWNRTMVSVAGLGLRNSSRRGGSRRGGRSLAVVGLLACGVFLVIAVGANRHDPAADAHKRTSGTGGFALYGESTIGILHDLSSESGREKMGLDDGSLEGVQIVQLRMHDGDDASCFNLNRAQRPRLLGVPPSQLKMRGSFTFAKVIDGAGKDETWDLLTRDYGDDVVPAVGDYATVIWALGKSVGQDLEYADEKGRTFRLRIVGTVKNSILQGSLLIAEEEFVERFPSEDGYRLLLVDAPEEKTDD
ncbi:MAG: ABC transporter permease, partial [Planctomycetota bacterium]